MLPVKRFTDFIEQNNLFAADSTVLTAVSGGMDSVLLANLLKAADFNFAIAHCNFQLRGDESTRDQEFCQHLALQLRVPFHTIKFNTLAFAATEKISTQMAARRLRYDWFEQVRREAGYDVIALAHHQNDAIETILLNLTRGTGIAGLHGIFPKKGALVRPLLFLNRDEIQNIIENTSLPYVEDSSNASAKYARNKIRQEVIPALKQLNPALEQTFEQNLRRFREVEILLTERVAEIKRELLTFFDDEVHIPLAGLKELKPQRLLLYHLLEDYGFNETSIDDLILALDKHPGRLFESIGFRLVVDRDKIIITKKATQFCTSVQIDSGEHSVDYGPYKLMILHDDSPLIIKNNPLAVSVDSDLLEYPLTLRPWQQGDYFYPLGMDGRKKLSDFFISQKVPLNKKQQVPLLVNGNGEVVWVAGYRMDHRFKVNDKTKKVTIFELYKL
jgi:tRNA(Ile)-lysidine synthase